MTKQLPGDSLEVSLERECSTLLEATLYEGKQGMLCECTGKQPVLNTKKKKVRKENYLYKQENIPMLIGKCQKTQEIMIILLARVHCSSQNHLLHISIQLFPKADL